MEHQIVIYVIINKALPTKTTAWKHDAVSIHFGSLYEFYIFNVGVNQKENIALAVACDIYYAHLGVGQVALLHGWLDKLAGKTSLHTLCAG